MVRVRVERLDHLGLIAGVIKELRIIDMIDARIEPDEREYITTGEAIAGMIINGLGFSNRAPSLTPQFFENKPMEALFREGVEADHFNRFKLGRSLDGYKRINTSRQEQSIVAFKLFSRNHTLTSLAKTCG